MVIEHRGEQQIVHNALVAGISMKRDLAGQLGEPVIAATFVADGGKAGNTDEGAWFERPTLTIHGVVHISHRDWIEKRSSLGYQEMPDPRMEKIAISEVLRAQHRAIDMLMAYRIMNDATFRPTQSGSIWSAVMQGSNMLNSLEAELGGQPFFKCPACHMVSYHPQDIEHGYCGRCHEFTGKGTAP